MNAIAPGVSECLDLLWFAGDVGYVPVLDIPARRGPLEVGIELDPVGRIEVDALYLAAEALALSERCHHLQAVAEDHTVGPVGVVLVELRLGPLVRQSVEIIKQTWLVAVC